MHVHLFRSAFSLSALLALTCTAPASHAFDFNDMMNPNRWMNGGNRNRDADAPPPVYVPPPAGYVPAAPPPYVAPTPAPGYYNGAPATVPTPVTPQTSTADKAEIEALKRRIEELERQQPSAPSAKSVTPAPRSPATDLTAPHTFRPLDQN
ncbi:hypothetical protein CKO09_09640 [Chromatium weissei]|nr:hypothetical protein [Chromatium weissei]